MTTSSLKMDRQSFAPVLFLLLTSMLVLASCSKHDPQANGNNNAVNAASFSPEVLDKWMTMQIRLMRNATGIQNQAFSRHYVYAGITALESLAPGLPGHHVWSSKWNGLTGLPNAASPAHYYLPANLNAAMAEINRLMFPNANITDKTAIDSLENALLQEFLFDQPQIQVNNSAAFGKQVATAVFNWAETDGYKSAGAAYTPPAGPGLWVPTPPAFANAATPYWGGNRTVISGSIQNTMPAPPVAYSEQTGSDFYNMVKEVYDISITLSNEEKAMATFWRDVPGVSSPGHWLSIVQQTVKSSNVSLDKAALAYALTGAAINDGLIGCWKAKYQYNLVRPVTYIRNVMGHSTWTSHLGTPPHPEYPSAHAVLSAAAAEVMQSLFGNTGSFTDHTYDYLGFSPRSYTSFTAIGVEAAQSRLYAGIHYQPSIDAGIGQGKKVATNILSNINIPGSMHIR